MDNAKQSFEILLSATAALSGGEPKATKLPDVATVLRGRLEVAYGILQESDHEDIVGMDLKTLQYVTARESLRVIEMMQDVLDSEGAEPPLLGSRDLSHLRTLLSVIFKWRVEPLLSAFESTRPLPAHPQIIDLTDRSIHFEELPGSLIRILRLLFGKDLRVRQTWITSCILSQHVVDVLLPCLVIGWAPKPLHETFIETGGDIKTLSIRLINLLRPNEAIAALGTILANINTKRKIYPYLPRVCGFLLSKQLGRPEGLRGLCIAILGDELEETEVVPLDKLEHICKVLRTVPSSTVPEDYFHSIIPRILELLVPSTAQRTPSAHKRAAAFTLSRMLSSDFQYSKIVSAILLPPLHNPFISIPTISEVDEQEVFKLSALESLQTLQTFILFSDPSPISLSILFTPIIPELYTLFALYRSSKVADPNIRESLGALLNSWGRIVFLEDAIEALWKIVLGAGGNWEISLDGFVRSIKPLTQPSISLLTATDLKNKSKDEVDITANPFSLRPDPSQFVAYMKTLDRQDVSSEIFIRLLNAYRDLKNDSEDPLKTLLYLQLILQMQEQLSTSVLSRPEHVLSFVKHALGSVPLSGGKVPPSAFKRGLGLDDLLIVDKQDDEGEGEGEGDSDDEGEDVTMGGENTQGSSGKDEVIVTSISLLLSILEGHPELSPNNTADLNDIMSLLGNLTSHTSPTIRQLAREARLVLTARSASTSWATTSNTRTEFTVEPAQAIYQKALKLLQDPIIPVRAHGLQLLRELASRSGKKSSTTSQDELLDPALVPGILSIFFQSIQDDDSFIYLNAVQGLAAMVDGYGKEVLKRLMDAYLVGRGVGGSGVGGTDVKEELDARIRIGEAISTVVKRFGDALGAYVDTLVPPLLTIVRSSHLPTTLRTSALSILAVCASSYVVALHPYVANLAETCIVLLQVESVAARPVLPKDKANTQTKSENEGALINKPAPLFPKPPSYSRGHDLEDQNPTTTISKIASFRRSAIHLFSQLFRAHIQLVYDEQALFASKVLEPEIKVNIGGYIDVGPKKMGGMVFPESVMRRAKIILGYVAITDEDGVCRVMAREARELVEQYEGAIVAGI